MIPKSQTQKPFAVSEDSKESEIVSFSQDLWCKCLEAGLPQSALTTSFVKGIQDGSLAIKNYAPFFIQDIYYLQHGSELWAQTAIRAEQQNKTDIAKYCNQRKQSWAEYAALFAKDWHVKPDGIVLGRAMSDYVEYEQFIVNKYGVEYIFIAFYACLKLWPYIGRALKSQQEDDNTNDDNKREDDAADDGTNEGNTKLANTNLYQFWIDENLSQKSATRNEQWMDSLYSQHKIDEHLVFEIVCNCLKLEINFFKEAGNEDIDVIHLYGIQQTQNNDGEYKVIKQKENEIVSVEPTTIRRSHSLPIQMSR